jgi:hypothetical protein
LSEIVKQAQDNAVGRENVTLKKRTDFSISHILAAAHFARLSSQVEKTYDGKCSDEVFHEHRAYVSGCIVSTVSFLEAKINELFADTVDNPNAVKQLDKTARDLMSGMWKGEILARAGFPILEKFQLALALARKDLFDRGKRPFQDVALLVRLRNALVHYVPEWVTFVSAETEDLTVQDIKRNLSGKFELNPLRGPADSFFPDRCLSHGCAKWAVTSSVEFVDEFLARMGLPRPYDHIRPRLNTEWESAKE